MRTLYGQQSHFRYPLTRLFGSPGHVRVLRVPADGLASSVMQIAPEAGLTSQGTRLVLEVLAAQGIVTVKGSARTELFELAAVHPIRSAVVSLFAVEQAGWEASVAQLRELLGARVGVQAAWLYGSVARGEDKSSSDIDLALLVLSPDVGDKVREDFMPMENELNVHVSVTALTPQDLTALRDDDGWWADVVCDARVLKGRSPEAEKKKVRARLVVA